jgi:DNA recombination protein RmuC
MAGLSFSLLGFSAIAAFFLIFLFIKLSEKLNQQAEVNSRQSNEIEKIKELINNQFKEIRGTVDGSSKMMIDQVRSFTKETTALKSDLRQIQEKVGDISSFQDIFKSPKLRGQWGEASLKHILSEYFPPELYEIQHLFSSGEQVDAVLNLPDGKILPIDAKFSSDNFGRMLHSQSKERDDYSKKFVGDIRERIREVASKYIRPAEGTVDFALMYIPAEAIYYEVMFNLVDEDLARQARKQKVIIASPNTIYLTLRTIADWFRDTQLSRKTQEILKRLERISQDARNLSDDFRKLGRHLGAASSAYDRSEKRLSLLGKRVETLIESDRVGEEKQLEQGS